MSRDADIAFAYLFGSHAGGQPTPLSDIDVAVYLRGILDDRAETEAIRSAVTQYQKLLTSAPQAAGRIGSVAIQGDGSRVGAVVVTDGDLPELREEIATGEDGWEQNGIDTTLQVSLAWHRGRFCGYHGGGATFYGSDGIDELNLRKRRYTMLHAVEYMTSPSFSWVLHLVAASPAADYPELKNPVVELTFGFKKRFRKGVLECGLIENLFFYDNSPDIGVHLAYTFAAF